MTDPRGMIVIVAVPNDEAEPMRAKILPAEEAKRATEAALAKAYGFDGRLAVVPVRRRQGGLRAGRVPHDLRADPRGDAAREELQLEAGMTALPKVIGGGA